MERITSRKNPYLQRLRRLGNERGFREAESEYICDGLKLLKEAVSFGAEVTSVLWKEKSEELPAEISVPEYTVPEDVYDYVSPLKNSPGPLFTVRMPSVSGGSIDSAIVLESVQDPGNVGTVIRTANAFKVGAVILTGDCADLYNPKTVRATMGAIFRQRVIALRLEELKPFLEMQAMPLLGAALTDEAGDIRALPAGRRAVAVGSEGKGLTPELLSMCDGQIIIPMNPDSESLNAAVAASVIMWELAGRFL